MTADTLSTIGIFILLALFVWAMLPWRRG